MRALLQILVIAAVLGVIGYLSLRPDPSLDQPGAELPRGAATIASDPGGGAIDPLDRADSRAAMPGSTETLPAASTEANDEQLAPAAQAAPPAPFAVRLVDLNGDPLAGVDMLWTGPHGENRMRSLLRLGDDDTQEPLTLRSDSEGWIRSDAITRAPSAMDAINDLAAASERLQVFAGGTGPDGEIVAALAPYVRMAGRVIDPEGRPVAGATVDVEGRLDGLTTFGLDLGDIAGRKTHTLNHSGSQGEFDLGWAPVHPEFRISVVRPNGGTIYTFEAPPSDDLGLELQLRAVKPRTPAAASVFGRVVRPDGSPVASASVSLDGSSTKTDADGRFRYGAWFGTGTLIARAPRGRFTAKTGLSEEEARSTGGSGPHVLVIPDKMKSLTVQVVDHQRRPVKGLLVTLADGTHLKGRRRFLEMTPMTGGRQVRVRTDERGVALLPYMLDREYRLRVINEETMFSMETEPLQAGQGLKRIVLPENPLAESLTGVVLDFHGAPVEGAPVQLQTATFKTTSGGGASSYLEGQSAVTDANGHFKMTDVPWEGASIRVSSPTDKYTEQTLEIRRDRIDEPFRFVLDQRCEVVLELAGAPEVDRLQARGADGSWAELIWIGTSATNFRHALPRAKSGSFPLSLLPQSVTEIVLFDGDKEIRTVAVQLKNTGRTKILL